MRFKAEDVEKYGGQGGGGYFSLKDDGATARVRFMYNNIDDFEGCAVHQVEIGDRKRYVNCLRDYNQPLEDCPFCREHKFQTVKFFVPVYNIDEDKVQVWERGKKFANQMSSLIARYSNANKPFCSEVFDIERQGKKNDPSTTYGIYSVDSDDTTLEDLPELPNIIGGVVLDKTADEMEAYLETGSFPPEDDEPIRRRDSRDSERRDSREERRGSREESRYSGRRTPVRRNEAF